MEPYLAPAFGALVLLALGVLIQLLREINRELARQGLRLERVATVVGIDGNGLMAKVESLSIAQAAEQARQVLELETELRALREERRHGLADRRDA